MFARRSQTSAEPAADLDAADQPIDPAQQPKGRPTPSRKDAEQKRKQTLKVPADPKAAKKAMRQREREARMEARNGLMAGDPRYLPRRDQGPAKAFTRDFVDGRRRLSEYFIFVAVGILLVSFFRNPTVVAVLSLAWLAIAAIVVLEVIWVTWSLSKQLKQRWPDKADRKGCQLYAVLRLLQIRRLRIPPPRIKPGGEPVPPKKNPR